MDANQLVKAQPQIVELEDEVKFLDDQIKQLGRSGRRTDCNGGKPFESRIISEEELTAFLDEGWDLVKELSNGKIVVRRALEA